MIEKFMGADKDDKEDIIPSFAYISLARRGMEKINLFQCFLEEGCDNEDINMLEFGKIEKSEDKDKKIMIVHVKCKKCNGTFQLKFETIKRVAKPTTKGKEASDDEALSMGLVYVLDKDGKNLGHLGYF